MVIKNAQSNHTIVAASVIHKGTTAAAEKSLLTDAVDPNFSAAKLLDELCFKDDRSSDYRVYFNTANFNARDTGMIQFVYVGYGEDKQPIYLSIGYVQSDFITLAHGAVLKSKDGSISWHKGGAFNPSINSSFNDQDVSVNTPQLDVMKEPDFIKTALSYIREFEDITHVDLNSGAA